MTTFIDFTPSATAPFQFKPTLDGAPYLVIVTWGLSGQRWYINLYDHDGARVFTLPLIGSSIALKTSSLVWDDVAGLVIVTTELPHGIPIGLTTQLTISGASPSAYNGILTLFSTGPDTLSYPQTTNPGTSSAYKQGNIGRDINIAGGYFTSTLVFRQATQQFEISP